MGNGFSVIMPTYNQASFIRKAIQSLLEQTISNWELIIINDGATDETYAYIKEYLGDSRFVYIENKENKGLGAAINLGLDQSKYNYIAYLPSDDFYYPDHLETLKKELDKSDEIALTYTKSRSEIKDSFSIDVKEQTNGLFDSCSLQLVQTAHRKTSDRWIERNQCVSNDLFYSFWNRLSDKGIFTYIDKETSSWTIHTFQYHKLINALNKFRQYYNVQEPLRVRTFESRVIDEVKLYKNYHSLHGGKINIKVLLVGELSYNPERIFALEEQGCQLFGLWMRNPTYDFSTVGHLPFGNVVDIPYEQWEAKVSEIQPDIIYAGLNFGAVPMAYEVLKKRKNIPFVWHFKEGPFICRQNGTWNKLIELYRMADGKIFLNEESKRWYSQFIPNQGLSFLLDGDLPKRDYFTNTFSARLSESDGEIHTVISGRPVNITIKDIEMLAKHKIHLHLYCNYEMDKYNREALKIAPNHYHIHPYCEANNWTEEFSKFDAGWLHPFDSENKGSLMRIGWNDLNIPARMSVLAAAGIPMIQKDNTGHIVAMQSCVQKNGLGVFYKDIPELAAKLYDRELMSTLRNNVLKNRLKFSFDYHVSELINFFKNVIEFKKKQNV